MNSFPPPGITLLASRLLTSFLTLATVLACPAPATSAESPAPIKAFCIDFNWGPGGINGFAAPGLWADASPEEHVKWYEALGCNVIQTFAVSCNGYAWYRGGAVPAQPGMKHDFLTETVRLGHARKIRVMGYFCVAANTRWGQQHPELSYGTPSAPHIPFTTRYLDDLCAWIAEALRKTGMDGFMIDWVWNPGDIDGKPLQWLDCEQQMYQELFGEPFPGKAKLTGQRELEFRRRAIDRCWDRIRAAAKRANPDCVIWLSCCNVESPAVAGSRMFREVDWLMNEATDPAVLAAIEKRKGPHTRLVQCVVGWGDRHDARKMLTTLAPRHYGIYGFAKPNPNSLPLPVPQYRSRSIASFQGNDRNIAVLARYYRGEPLDLIVSEEPERRAGLSSPAMADLQARLARVPKPWTTPMPRLTREQYEETLRFWAERHPKLLVLESRGTSREKVPLYLLKITDQSAPDADKQICLITALHSGNERSGGNTVLALAEWLLGDEPEAAEIRRKQIVLLMPIVNPFGYFGPDNAFNSQGVDPYAAGRGKLWDLKTLTFTAPDRSPEIQAYVGVVDQYRPEVHADVHGISEQYAGQTMFEITGSAYSNFTLRPWDWRVTEAMIAAGREAGYGSERFEADGQRLFWGPALDPIADRLWLGRPYFYTAHYGYAKYHTMITALEVGWEQSGVARLRGLLRLGNKAWDGEPVAGYPVDRLSSYFGHFVVAWGTRSDQRRRSRVELWQRQSGFSQAMLYPQTDGRESYVLALSDKAAKLLDSDKARFLANLRGRPGFSTEAIEAFVQAGPEARWLVNELGPPAPCGDRPIEHGLALRLRLPYRNPELVDLRLNGHLIPPSRTDGYQQWFADGYTQVQIHVSPEKSRQMDLLVVTCAYRPDVQRQSGFRPPKEVLERLDRAKKGR